MCIDSTWIISSSMSIIMIVIIVHSSMNLHMRYCVIVPVAADHLQVVCVLINCVTPNTGGGGRVGITVTGGIAVCM